MNEMNLFVFIILSCSLLMTTVVALSIKKPKIAVIGGGWSGWSAAKTLCENGCDVTLLDAVYDPAGKLEMKSITGKPIQPGERGFWYDYPNIAQLLKELNITESSVFTDYTDSSFYSPDGLEATAPVFSSSEFPQLPSPLGQVFASFSKFKRLPLQDRASMVGLLYAILDLYRNEETFKAYDRMSAYDLFTTFGVSKRLIDDFLRPTLLVGLFKPPEELSAAVSMELLYYYALAHQTSFDVRWIKQGSVAGNFFKPLSIHLENTYGLKVLGGSRVTKIAFEDEELISRSSVSSSSVSDSTATTTNDNNDKTMNKAILPSNKISSVYYTSSSSSSSSSSQCLENLDGVILAVGTGGMRNILYGSPNLANKSLQLSKAASLRSIDCISARIWLDKNVTTVSPVNVFAKFTSLRGAGGTFFMLNELQKDNIDDLWGSSSRNSNSISGSDSSGSSSSNSIPAPATATMSTENTRGSVVAVDFYNVGALLPLSDEAILTIIKRDLLDQVDESDFRSAKILDSDVKRYPQAVSWFSPGSYDCRPRTVVDGVNNLFVAGDWVVIQNDDNNGDDDGGIVGSTTKSFSSSSSSSSSKWNDKSNNNNKKNNCKSLESTTATDELTFNQQEHGAKGLCQERAYVSGLVAANRMLDTLSMTRSDYQIIQKAKIIPIRSDEIQVKVGTQINRKIQTTLSKLFGGTSPWLR